MPRYIDADALYDNFKNGISDTEQEKEFNRVGRYLVRHAPTADVVPVVRGEWVVTDAYPHRVYCSLCYKTNVPNEEWLYEKNDYPKYCMWCGAKMEDKP